MGAISMQTHPDISGFSTDISGTEIIYIKDFLSLDKCQKLIDAANKLIEEQSDNSDMVGYTNDGNVNSKSAPYVFLHKEASVSGIISEIKDNSIRIYEELYGVDQNRTYIDLGTINVMGAGIGMKVHADNPPSLAQGIDTPHGLVLYLNEDYLGGEIYYSKLGIVIKPEAGSLVIHPGTIEYSHGVIPVVSGTRYATTAFSKKPVL
jgi:hypothetical protein